METFFQQVINGLVLGSMYALVALGYTMVYGIINLINFAHGEVLMVGALSSWTVVSALETTGMPGWLRLLLSVPVSIAICATLNFAIDGGLSAITLFATSTMGEPIAVSDTMTVQYAVPPRISGPYDGIQDTCLPSVIAAWARTCPANRSP